MAHAQTQAAVFAPGVVSTTAQEGAVRPDTRWRSDLLHALLTGRGGAILLSLCHASMRVPGVHRRRPSSRTGLPLRLSVSLLTARGCISRTCPMRAATRGCGPLSPMAATGRTHGLWEATLNSGMQTKPSLRRPPMEPYTSSQTEENMPVAGASTAPLRGMAHTRNPYWSEAGYIPASARFSTRSA